jgi:hypothetical protein
MNDICTLSVIQLQCSRGTTDWNSSFSVISSDEYVDMILVYVECNRNVSEAQRIISKYIE